MFHYGFTNDLRFDAEDINSFIEKRAELWIEDKVPSAYDDKSLNNTSNAAGAYFNLRHKGNCAKAAINGNVQGVLLNFIKKFQFPNPIPRSYQQTKDDGIKLVPLRTILKTLYTFYLSDGDSGYLTKEEIIDFIFYNKEVAKQNDINYMTLYYRIKTYRNDGKLPEDIIAPQEERNWNYQDRQLGTMMILMSLAKCIKIDEEKYKINLDIDKYEKIALFDILTCDTFWENEDKQTYYEYMEMQLEEELEEEEETTEQKHEISELTLSQNRIVYGAPGTGKSQLLKDDIEKYGIDNEHYERVTFYPDYSYGQFVGMYKPVSEGDDIKYKFVEGPFLRLLVKALKNQEEDFVLIIEEINRANAASVFGDMFQLLDRDEDGNSEYFISISKDVKKYLEKEEININKLYIPSNFYIWATMNSADQGVMPLDSAFKRRFDDYKLVGINENDKEIEEIKVNINGIGDNIEWNDFRKALNKCLADTFNVKEDKLIGPFFIKPNILKNHEKFNNVFQDKLLMYLAEDVLNHKKQQFFGTSSLSEIKENYKDNCAFKIKFWDDLLKDENMQEVTTHVQNEQTEEDGN